MSKLLVRHGLSDANDRAKRGTPAFGNPNASLMSLGIDQAVTLGESLTNEFGIDLASEPVGVSTLLRSQETAVYAGFCNLIIYPELNEEKGSLNDQEVRDALHNWDPPEATIRAARLIIENPPRERILIFHAFVIGAICHELGLYTDAKRFVPEFCEVRMVPL